MQMSGRIEIDRKKYTIRVWTPGIELTQERISALRTLVLQMYDVKLSEGINISPDKEAMHFFIDK